MHFRQEHGEHDLGYGKPQLLATAEVCDARRGPYSIQHRRAVSGDASGVRTTRDASVPPSRCDGRRGPRPDGQPLVGEIGLELLRDMLQLADEGVRVVWPDGLDTLTARALVHVAVD